MNIPNIFSAGAKAIAAKFNENNEAIKTAINDTDSRVTMLESETNLKPDGSIPATAPLSYKKSAITGATNATPIEITSAMHGRETGDKVYIEGVLGNLASNGTFTITETGQNTFTLDSSVGNGNYISGGTCCLMPQKPENIVNKKYADGIISLFDFKTSDHLIIDTNWALADGSWLDGTVYADAYNLLLAQYNSGTSKTDNVVISNINNTPVNNNVTYNLGSSLFKVVNVSNVSGVDTLYTNTGSAWYYVLDTVNERFKLPRCENFLGLTSDLSKVGEYSKDQIVNIVGALGANSAAGVSGAFAAGTANNAYGYSPYSAAAIQTIFDASKVVNTGDRVSPRHNKMLLYFKVK